MANTELEFVGLSGKTLTKEPGSINGESFTIRDLENCTVYLLDYTSLVEVKNVQDCQIFIGPVDGPAIFENVSNSRIAVVAQQFQAKAVSDSEFDLFSATQPTLNNCSEVKIGCWRGSYPGLTQHFHEANLDPNSNHWDKAKDISSDDSEAATFQLVHDVQPWEVPIEGGGLPDNPVPYATENGGFGFNTGGTSLSNGHASDFSEPPAEHPKLTAINAKLRERQEAQVSHEKQVKTELVQRAANYLEDFYKNRQGRVQQRAKTNRETEQGLTVAGPEGNTEWEKTVNLINFGFSRPSGTDLSRFKNVLFSAKSKNVPIASKTGL